MSDGRGQEYLDENLCLHDNVYIDDFEVIISGDDPSTNVLVTIRCEKCSKSQERTLCFESILEDLNLGWEE